MDDPDVIIETSQDYEILDEVGDDFNDETFGCALESDVDFNGVQPDPESFFGFKTDIPRTTTHADHSDHRGEEDEKVDEFNDITFGNGAEAGDWETEHDCLVAEEVDAFHSDLVHNRTSPQAIDRGGGDPDSAYSTTPSHVKEMLQALSLQIGSLDTPESQDRLYMPYPGLSSHLASTIPEGKPTYQREESFAASSTLNMLPDFLLADSFTAAPVSDASAARTYLQKGDSLPPALWNLLKNSSEFPQGYDRGRIPITSPILTHPSASHQPAHFNANTQQNLPHSNRENTEQQAKVMKDLSTLAFSAEELERQQLQQHMKSSQKHPAHAVDVHLLEQHQLQQHSKMPHQYHPSVISVQQLEQQQQQQEMNPMLSCKLPAALSADQLETLLIHQQQQQHQNKQNLQQHSHQPQQLETLQKQQPDHGLTIPFPPGLSLKQSVHTVDEVEKDVVRQPIATSIHPRASSTQPVAPSTQLVGPPSHPEGALTHQVGHSSPQGFPPRLFPALGPRLPLANLVQLHPHQQHLLANSIQGRPLVYPPGFPAHMFPLGYPNHMPPPSRPPHVHPLHGPGPVRHQVHPVPMGVEDGRGILKPAGMRLPERGEHWMTDRDIESVVRIQQLQLHSDKRYLCDPYGQILIRKRMFSDSGVDVASRCDLHLKWYLFNMLMFRRPLETKPRTFEPAKFEGVLGKLVSSTVYNPRTLVSVLKRNARKLSSPTSLLTQRPTMLLFHIEAMYDLWNEAELEMDAGLRYVLAAINSFSQRGYEKLGQMRMLLSYVMCVLVEDGLHLDEPGFFTQYMAVQKGKELLATILPYWTGHLEKAEVWWAQLLLMIITHLPELLRSDRKHNLLIKLLPSVIRAYPLLEVDVVARIAKSLHEHLRAEERERCPFLLAFYLTVWMYLQKLGLKPLGRSKLEEFVGDVREFIKPRDAKLTESLSIEWFTNVHKHSAELSNLLQCFYMPL